MTNQKQIEANRKNAQWSTGPITNEGKAVVSRNATRHGILSAHVRVDDNEHELYLNFHESMQKELDPRGDMEFFLVDRIISTAWRLRRIVHIESLMLKKAQESLYGSKSYKDAFEGNASGHMMVISRYERSLENALFRAIKEFKTLHEEQLLEVVNIPL
ncbi:hypothetical protein N9Y92_01360 [Chlamydiales bacterium]|nr:hypothetical protein [Chlamydiales bacterium]